MARRSKGRDMRYPELSHTRQVARAARRNRVPGTNFDDASHTVERARAWRHIVTLAAKHELSLESIGKYMSTPEEWGILQARFIERPMLTYARLGRRLRRSMESVENTENRALLRLLTRMIAYDQSVGGDPDGFVSGLVRHWD